MNQQKNKGKRTTRSLSWRGIYAYLNSLDDEILRVGFVSIIVISGSIYQWFDEGWYEAWKFAIIMSLIVVSIYLAAKTIGIVFRIRSMEFEPNYIKKTTLLFAAWMIIAFFAKEVFDVPYERAVRGLGLMLGYVTVVCVIAWVVYWIQTRRGR